LFTWKDNFARFTSDLLLSWNGLDYYLSIITECRLEMLFDLICVDFTGGILSRVLKTPILSPTFVTSEFMLHPYSKATALLFSYTFNSLKDIVFDTFLLSNS